MGPLNGVKVIEFAGIGPGPMCGMMLADMGATVLRIDRKNPITHYAGQAWDSYNPGRYGVLNRGKQSVTLNLKTADGIAAALRLIDGADALIDPFRPGVMEKLGLGPDVCLARNPRLVFGRMTGFGQDGPLAQAAGHDLNYIGLSGALHVIGRPGEAPPPPLAYIGDFGGGACMLAFGIACALYEARGSGQGQVLDSAMSEGSGLLAAMMYGMYAQGAWQPKGRNRIDGGAHFYDVYECKDGKYVTIAAAEPQFYAELLQRLGITEPDILSDRMNPDRWPEFKARFAAVFKTRTRDEWSALLEGTDVCFAPMLDFAEAPRHPHAVARKAFVEVDGVVQPAPTPRFSRTAPEIRNRPPVAGENNRDALTAWGFSEGEIDALAASGVM
ncbi:MAG TPA: CaiB/BaiF CoA-transferase family protein [Gammaproteobacteria bacterium]|mgnify:CR=1 FL=1|nr:CaiB/BaiF CoA-transferase family protein [Gammaproteobacteria bacterium]